MASPALVWESFDLYAGRTEDYRVKLYKTNKRPAALAAGDVVRFKLCTAAGEDPTLDIDSIAPTDNGSVCTIAELGEDNVTPAEIVVRVAQADSIDLEPGKWFGEVGVVDDSETNPADAFKVAGRGPILVKASPGGDVGTT